VLKIRPGYEGGWCYNPKDVSQAVVLSQCNKLRSLSVALISISIEAHFEPNNWAILDYLRHKYRLGDDLDDGVCFDDHLTVFSSLSQKHYYRCYYRRSA
jgi:hypothetical protein